MNEYENEFPGRRLVVCVPAPAAAGLLSALSEKGFLDRERKTESFSLTESGAGCKNASIVLIPVLDHSDVFSSGMLPQEASIASRTAPVFIRKPVSLKTFARRNRTFLEQQSLFFTDEEISRFPAGRQMIGDIAVLTIPETLREREYDIARVLVLMDPRIRIVLSSRGIKGSLREPDRIIIYPHRPDGLPSSGFRLNTEVVHEENGCRFRLDAMKLMFSKGNLDEKRRMSRLGAGETVVDMFAGIGYFTIPMAVHARPKEIIAIELNPVAFRYLCENIRLNHADAIVSPVPGDCGSVTPEGIADRVLMGYVGTTEQYLDAGIRAIKKEGGFLHYHETVPEHRYPERPAGRVREAAAENGRTADIVACRVIKKYAPGVLHVVVDARIR